MEVSGVEAGPFAACFEASLVGSGAQEIEGEVAHKGHVRGAVTFAQAREVLAEGDVEHPVSGVRNYPRPRERGSGADGFQDCTEDSGPGRQASGVDHGAHGGFALRGPHRPVAVGDLALDDGRSQGPLAGVVGHFDPTGMIQEGQELIARPADLGLERPCQVAPARRGET